MDPGIEPERRRTRSEVIRGAVNHDLSNMVVALNGLLHMLADEEADRLGPAGRDYLERLFGVAGRLESVITSLQSLHQVAPDLDKIERVPLGEVFREAAATARTFLSGSRARFQSFLQVPELMAPRAVLSQALAALIGILGWRRSDVAICFSSRHAGDSVELCLTNSAKAAKAIAPGGPPLPLPDWRQWKTDDYASLEVETRLQLVLVEDLALSWGGRLTVYDVDDASQVFVLRCPPAAVVRQQQARRPSSAGSKV